MLFCSNKINGLDDTFAKYHLQELMYISNITDIRKENETDESERERNRIEKNCIYILSLLRIIDMASHHWQASDDIVVSD